MGEPMTTGEGHERDRRDLRGRTYPETGAGGFSRIDGTVEFFSRVQALLPDQGVVVDLGAGRGKWQEDTCAWRHRLCDLRGDRRLIVGADVDAAVEQNSGVDAAVILAKNGRLPFRDHSVGAVVADWVLEHLRDPAVTAQELARVVVPGGWVCARTPNRWGYIGIGARMIPNNYHTRFLNRLQPDRRSRDVFSVCYRLNTLDAIWRAFPDGQWRHCSYTYNPDPSYFGHSRAAFRLIEAWQRVAPRSMAAALHVFVQRRDKAPAAGA